MPNHVTNRITTSAAALVEYIGEATHERTSQMYKTFDFNQIVPCPKIISTESVCESVKTAAEIALGLINFKKQEAMPDNPLSNAANMSTTAGILHRSNAMRQLLEGPMPKNFSNEDFESFVQCLRAWRETKSLNWYDWNLKHWGTKWNAYNVIVASPTVLEFDTAWNAPHPVIHQLAHRLGEDFGCGLKHEWADEDIGHNVGYVVYDNNGEPTDHKELSETRVGYELAFELRGFCKLEDGLYACDVDDADRYRWNGETYVYEDNEETP